MTASFVEQATVSQRATNEVSEYGKFGDGNAPRELAVSRGYFFHLLIEYEDMQRGFDQPFVRPVGPTREEECAAWAEI